MGAERVLVIGFSIISVFFLLSLLTPSTFKALIKQKQNITLIDCQQKTEIILEQYLRFLYYYYNKPLFEYLDKPIQWYRIDLRFYKMFLMKKVIEDLNKLTDLSESIAKTNVQSYMKNAKLLEQCNGKLALISNTFNLNIHYLGVK